jgi:hypothetical protein
MIWRRQVIEVGPLGHLRAPLTLIFATSALLCLAANLPAQLKTASTRSLQDFAGTWVVTFDGKNLMVLTLELANGKLSGNLGTPESFQMDQGGEFSHISPKRRDNAILEASVIEGDLQFKTGSASDSDEYVLKLTDRDHALLQMRFESKLVPDPPWKLVRVSDSEKPTVAANWDVTGYSKEILALQSELNQMVEKDQAVRKEVPILQSKMKQVDDGNYPEILRIYEQYKWPLISVVGRSAAHNYWLLVQHQDLEFQRRVLPDLQRAVEAGEASKVDYAYLYDRVMFFQGKPQHWGTQGDCKNGRAVLAPVDDPAGLEQRRKDLHLMPVSIDEYLKLLDRQCADYVNDAPPSKPQL